MGEPDGVIFYFHFEKPRIQLAMLWLLILIVSRNNIEIC